MPVSSDERVLVDWRTADDAGVYRLDERRALVQTVDFFTPVVDDPTAYGRIAGANALSDIYAMGGRPLTALAIAGFPKEADAAILSAIFRGGLQALDEAATEGLRPDLTLLLDLPAEAGLARVTPDDVTRFEADHDIAFHRRVRDGFLRLAAEAPERFVIVDATRSADDVATEIWRAVGGQLGGPVNEPNAPSVRMNR